MGPFDTDRHRRSPSSVCPIHRRRAYRKVAQMNNATDPFETMKHPERGRQPYHKRGRARDWRGVPCPLAAHPAAVLLSCVGVQGSAMLSQERRNENRGA